MRRALSGLLYVFLGLPVALSALLTLSVRPWALDRGFYDRAIEDERLWTALRSPEALKGAPESVEINGYLFSGPALYGAFQRHLPEAELKALGRGAVEDILGALETRRPPTPLDLRPLKARLSRDREALAADYFAALPAGTPSSDSDLRTRAPTAAGTALVRSGSQALGSLVDAIPDEASPQIRVESGRSLVVFGPESTKTVLDRLARDSALAGGALLLGLGFLGGGGVGRSLSRTGRFLILPSALVLAAGLALSIPGAPLFIQALEQIRPAPELGFLKSLGGWLGSWLGVAARSFFVVGLSGLSLGALLASLRRIFEPREY